MKKVSPKKIFFSGIVSILLLWLGANMLFSTDIERFTEKFFSRTVFVGERQYVLERADTDIKREKGLGERDALCKECGMLFVFDEPGQYAFWMKDMRFPLDIVWLSGDNVVFVAHNVQPDFSGIIEPGVAADRVIEVNAGAAESLESGGKVRFSYGSFWDLVR